MGDTVRVVGRIDEWQRRKASGQTEWVRQVIVEEGAGGSIGKSSHRIEDVKFLGYLPTSVDSCY